MKIPLPRFVAVLIGIVLCGAACDGTHPTAPLTAPIQIPAVSLAGHGFAAVGAMVFRNGVGTCEVNGVEVPAVVDDVSRWLDSKSHRHRSKTSF